MMVSYAPPGPPVPNGATLAAEPLSQADYERIKAYSPDYKYLLLMKILRNTGLREAEVLRATAEYFWSNGPLHYIRTVRGKKGAKAAWVDVALHPELGQEVAEYIRGNRIRPGVRVFPYTARRFQQVFRAASIAALGRPAHPHQLRHLFTKSLIDGGVPLAAAAKLLGHTDEATTLKHYYDMTTVERGEIARRMPV